MSLANLSSVETLPGGRIFGEAEALEVGVSGGHAGGEGAQPEVQAAGENTAGVS